MGTVGIGLNLIFLSALANGTFALLLTRRKTYRLEHMWSAAFLLGYFAFPVVFISIYSPGWTMLLQGLGSRTFIIIFLGAGWGVASLFFVKGISTMGLSSGYAIIFGVAIALGSAIPLIRQWTFTSSHSRTLILVGIGVCITGVILSSIAASKKQPVNRTEKSNTPLRGISACIISGALSACANIGYDLTGHVVTNAQRLGIGTLSMSITRWIPIYVGGCAVVLCYSSFKITRARTWNLFVSKGFVPDLLAVLVIAILLILGQVPYGAGTYFLGRLGVSVGWAVYISLSIIVANISGFLRGEWNAAPGGHANILIAGILLLIVGVVIITWGNNVALGQL
ncbi:MAG: hypothetical protein HN368_04980 [Spirochaetales bacterium]|jgi:L-rhamnose-H+ transport protein|nr:hypothetical protein [Spirochaetales bacterium]